MKSRTVLYLVCFCLTAVASWAQPYYNQPGGGPYGPDESRREEALKEKAEKSAVRKKALYLAKENKDLMGEIAKLKSQLTQKDDQIQALKLELYNLNKELEALKTTKKTNKDGVVIDDWVVHSKPFFDVYLGESFLGLTNRIAVESKAASDDETQPGQAYRIKPTRDNLQSMSVRVHQNRVCEVVVSYKDTSRGNYESIKKQLLKTFQPKEKAPGEILLSNDCMYTTVLDGIPVDIIMDYTRTPGKPRSLSLHYIHRLLLSGVGVEQKKHQTSSQSRTKHSSNQTRFIGPDHTSRDLPLRFISEKTTWDGSGKTCIWGKVVNDNNVPYKYVKVIITALDENGEFLGRTDWHCQPDEIGVGQTGYLTGEFIKTERKPQELLFKVLGDKAI